MEANEDQPENEIKEEPLEITHEVQIVEEPCKEISMTNLQNGTFSL